jgi:hypothetical protein
MALLEVALDKVHLVSQLCAIRAMESFAGAAGGANETHKFYKKVQVSASPA